MITAPPPRNVLSLTASQFGWIDPLAPVNFAASLQKTLAKSLKGSPFKKRISILGSTGSIGTQTLEIDDACPDNYVVDALSAGSNTKLMAKQVLKYAPKVLSLSTSEAATTLRATARGQATMVERDMFVKVLLGVMEYIITWLMMCISRFLWKW